MIALAVLISFIGIVIVVELRAIIKQLTDLNNIPTVVNVKVPEPKHEVAPVSAPSVVDHLPVADHFALNPRARRPE